MTDYGVLLVGCKRSHQESHAAVFAAQPRCRLVAVAAEAGDPEGRVHQYQQLADELNLPFIPDLDEALARDDVHIVSSTPAVERRGAVAVRCLEAGKHVYLDKPLAGSVEDADAIVAASRRAVGRAQMFTQNEAGWVKAARRAVQEGRVGEIKAVHAETLFSKGRAGSVPDATVRREKESVERWTFVEAKREMFDVAVYSLGFIHAVTGLKAESVFAHTGNYFFAEHVGVDVEDFGALAMKLEGGVTATAIGGRFGWMSHPKSGPQRLVVMGTAGTMTFDGFHPRIEVYNDEPDFATPLLDPLDPMGMWGASNPRFEPPPKRRWVGPYEERSTMAADVAAFIDCIERGREPQVNAEVAASLLEVLLAGYISAARNEEIALPLPRDRA